MFFVSNTCILQKPSILICVHSDKENCEIGNNPQLSSSSVNHQFYLYSEQGEHISMSARCNMMPTPELPVNKEIKLLLITSNNPLNRTEVVDSVMFDPITLSLTVTHLNLFHVNSLSWTRNHQSLVPWAL